MAEITTERDYVDSQIKVIEERLRGVALAQEVADDEREKAAAQLRSEQHRALDQANQEREKAAVQLRVELARAIAEGDDRLREHISNQIQQINAALISGEKLELERLARVDADVRSLAREQTLLRETSTAAQNKFENEVAARFTQVNEFRASLDDLGKAMATRRELESSQATSQGRYEDLSKQLQELRSRLDTGPADLRLLQQRFDVGAGVDQGAVEARAASRSGITFAQGLLATAIAIVALIFGALTLQNRLSNNTPATTVTIPTVVTVTTP